MGLPCKPQSISIHALREEGDRGHSSGCSLFCYFYPRPPRGGRPAAYSGPPSSMTFLSTPSARRATAGTAHCPDRRTISIHALREEGDHHTAATCAGGPAISIHALREEGDQQSTYCFPLYLNFYPRPPRGGRPQLWHLPALRCGNFYPRPPRGGRRCRWTALSGLRPISIHALREEGDQKFIDRQSAN